MLEEGAYDGEVQVIACYYGWQGETQAVADELEGDIVDVGLVTREEDDALFLLCGFGGYIAKMQDLVARDVDALVVGAGEELRAEVIGRADEVFTLHLANHLVRPVLSDLTELSFNLTSPFKSPLPVLMCLALWSLGSEQALVNLDLYPFPRQLGNLLLQTLLGHDHTLHVFTEAWVEDLLPDNLVVAPPSFAEDVEPELLQCIDRLAAESRVGFEEGLFL